MVEIIERNRKALGLSNDVSELVSIATINHFVSIDLLEKSVDGLVINDGVIVDVERYL